MHTGCCGGIGTPYCKRFFIYHKTPHTMKATNKLNWSKVVTISKLSLKLAQLYIKAEILKVKLAFKNFLLCCYFF